MASYENGTDRYSTGYLPVFTMERNSTTEIFCGAILIYPLFYIRL